MEIKFRQALENELPNVLSLLKEAATALRDKGLQQWKVWLHPDDEYTAWISKGLKNGEFYVVEDPDGTEIGMFRLSDQDEMYWGIKQDKASYLHSLLVKKGFSGKNAGGQIIKQIETDLLAQGTPILRLDCHAGNQWLCNYYEQLGFVQVGQKEMPHSVNNLYEKKLV